jgi:hypothetical protein
MPAKRRFTATQETTARDLNRIVKATLGGTGLKVAQDYDAGAVTVQFDRKGRRYRFDCDRWENPLDNLRAVGLRIDHMWRALTYGVTTSDDELPPESEFERLFLGFSPPPDDSVLMLGAGKRDWWDVLGIPRAGATGEGVRNAYRALAQIHHPDHGGSPDEFKRLVEAYKAAVAEVGNG